MTMIRRPRCSRARSRSTGVAALVVLALIASSCSDQGSEDKETSRASVSADTPTTVSTDGVSVELPSGSAEAGSTLQVQSEPLGDRKLPAGVTALSDFAVVTLSSALKTPAEVSFDAPSELGADLVPVVLWENSKGGWDVLPRVWSEGDNKVVATTNHFSGGLLGGFNPKKFASEQLGTLKRLIGGRAGKGNPKCAGEGDARSSGITVSSSGGDTVKWCFGRESGTNILKITNNRNTFTLMTFPSSWKVVNDKLNALSTDSLARAWGAAGGAPRGKTDRVVDGGDTLEIRIPDGARGQLRAEMSVGAWAVSGIVFGLKVYGAAINKLDSSLGKKLAFDDPVLLRILTGAGDSEEAEVLRSCANDLGDLGEVEPGDIIGVFTAGVGCGADVAKYYVKAGLSGWAAKTASAVVGVVAVAVTAVKLLFSGLRELFDTAAMLGGNSTPYYSIKVAPPAPAVSNSDADHESPTKVVSNLLAAINANDRAEALEWGTEDVVNQLAAVHSEGASFVPSSARCEFTDVSYICEFGRRVHGSVYGNNELEVQGTYQDLLAVDVTMGIGE